ncbi:MAG: envelope stress response membrane protein PspB [Panacagrimonas sp.]
MEDLFIPIFALLCIFVLLPGMVLVFIDRQRRHRTEAASAMSPSTAAAQTDLVRIAERMERRIEALEKLLDAEAPGWRTRDAE